MTNVEKRQRRAAKGLGDVRDVVLGLNKRSAAAENRQTEFDASSIVHITQFVRMLYFRKEEEENGPAVLR